MTGSQGKSDCKAPAGADRRVSKGDKPSQQCDALLGASGRPPNCTPAAHRALLLFLCCSMLLFQPTPSLLCVDRCCPHRTANAQRYANLEARSQEIAAERGGACTDLTFVCLNRTKRIVDLINCRSHATCAQSKPSRGG